ncbi:MAG: hypothetical protein F4X14_13600 [Caldilineaceae bacterium SB0661_bin_32]|uniref:Uncharacterized protein n=1 Tax=Caldilineaceae bacterium SB0661_bin_32 TaxID=2605255 RepID=A0A6B1D7K9_9CHLR|nr:hypothetical protein [Caldilineaceae bacterium SB0661_bin_32]
MPNVVNWREAQPVVSHDSAIVWSCQQPKPAGGDGARHLLPETTYYISNKDEARLTYLLVAAR